MILAALVVEGDVLLYLAEHDLVGQDKWLAGLGLGAGEFEGVVELARVAAGKAHQGLVFFNFDIETAEFFVLFQCALEQTFHIRFAEGLHDIDLAAREQGADDLEGGIFRGSAHEGDGTFFHGPQQRILLRLAEAMYFVDE